MKIDTTAAAQAEALRRARDAVRAELRRELTVQTERAAAVMRVEAPKFRSTLAGSVRIQRISDDEIIVRPQTDYAAWVVHGRKPGKGLPRFFDPRAAGIVAWLESKLQAVRRSTNPLYRTARRGSARFTAEELDLRDRYFMLSRAIKAHGIAPNNFPRRTLEKVQPGFNIAMVAALRRGLAQVRTGTPGTWRSPVFMAAVGRGMRGSISGEGGA